MFSRAATRRTHPLSQRVECRRSQPTTTWFTSSHSHLVDAFVCGSSAVHHSPVPFPQPTHHCSHTYGFGFLSRAQMARCNAFPAKLHNSFFSCSQAEHPDSSGDTTTANHRCVPLVQAMPIGNKATWTPVEGRRLVGVKPVRSFQRLPKSSFNDLQGKRPKSISSNSCTPTGDFLITALEWRKSDAGAWRHLCPGAASTPLRLHWPNSKFHLASLEATCYR